VLVDEYMNQRLDLFIRMAGAEEPETVYFIDEV
jgi:hypothetical protein